MKKIFVFCISIIVLLLSLDLHASNSRKTLETGHFIIKYNANNSSFAFSLIKDLGYTRHVITEFLNYDTLKKITIIVDGKDNTKESDPLNIQPENVIYIQSAADYERIKIKIYSEIFHILLKEIFQTENPGLIFNKTFISALIEYPMLESKVLKTMINDLSGYLESEKAIIDINNIEKFSNEQQYAITRVFIHFVISKYNKKIFIQSLKDTGYYHGLIKSLSMITGDSPVTIASEFNNYIRQNPLQTSISTVHNNIPVHENSDFRDIKFAVSGDESIAYLQQKENRFQILIEKKSETIIIPLNNTQGQSCYNNIVFINPNLLVIIEIIETGTHLYSYDIVKSKLTKIVNFPYLYITDIDSSNNNSIIFSALSGIKSDIYSFNIENFLFNILTESGNNYSPVIIKNNTYYITNTDKYNIVELNTVSGETKNIFSTELKITNISAIDDKMILLTTDSADSVKIYNMDLQSGKMSKLIEKGTDLLKAKVYGTYIMHFCFYKNRYYLFKSGSKL